MTEVLIENSEQNMLGVVTALEDQIQREPNNLKVVAALGNIYFNQNNYFKAAETLEKIVKQDKQIAPGVVLQFENVLAKHPRNRELLRSMIKLHLAEGCLPDVLGEISEYLDVQPDDQEMLQLLLKIAHEYKRLVFVLPVLEKARKANPRNSSLLEVLAGIYLNQQNHGQAIKLYEEAVLADERNLSAWLVLAELYVQHSHFEKAFAAYKKVLSLSSRVDSLIVKLEKIIPQIKDPQVFVYLLAEAYVRNTKPDKAIEQYRLILERNSAEAPQIVVGLKNLLKAYPDYPEASFLLARAASLAGSYTEAVAVLNKILKVSAKYADRIIEELNYIIQLCPTQVLARQSLAELYLLKADHLQALEQFNKLIELNPEEAENIVNKARNILKENSNMVRAREIIARYYFSKNQHRKAIAEAEAIIAIAPSNVEAFLILGRSQLALEEIEPAFTTFKMALSFDPYNKETHEFYKNVFYQRLDKKIVELAKAANKDPWKYSLHSELGTAYFHKGQLKEAIGEFQLAVRDTEKAPEIHKMLGICFKEQGRYDLAVEQFMKALEGLDKNDVPGRLKLLFYIGLAYEAEGKHQEALKVYEEIMTQDLNYENIQLRIEKLKSFSWVEVRGKALAAVIQDVDGKAVICSWAKNSESEDFHKKHKNKNVDLSFSMEHNNKAVEHALKGRTAAAEEELLLAEQMDPKFTIVYNNRAVLAMTKGDWPLAKEALDKALELNPKLPILFANLAVYYHLQGEDDKAMNNYEKCLALDDSLFITHINLGDLLYKKGQVERAMGCWERALQLGVVPELAKRRLKYKQIQ